MDEPQDPGTTPFIAVGPEEPLATEPSSRFRSYRTRRRAKKATRSKLRRRLTRSGIGLVLLIVIVLGGSAIYIDINLHRIGHLPGIKVKPIASGGADDILMVGSTDRCLVKPAKNFEAWVQQCAAGVNGNNSDVIMILRLVPGKSPTLLSIPRDTFVPDARGGDLSNKVDAALFNGPNQLIQAIEEDFGIPINHFVVLNFQTFTDIVDALGGITMYFPTSLKDNDSGLYISHSGCLHISGAETLALVRARHLYYHYDKKTNTWLGYDGSGDIGRIERDQIFLKVLAAKVAAQGLGNPIVDSRLLSSVSGDLTVDSEFSTSDMVHLILDYHSNVGRAPELTLPVIEDVNTYYYKGYNYGDVVFPAEPQDQQAVAKFMGEKPAGSTLKPASISVSVVDGNTSPSQAQTVEAELRALGYQVTDGGSRTSVGPVSETSVFYSGKGKSLAEAQRVLKSLSGTVVLAKGPTVGGADVTVVTGSYLSVAEPNAAAVSENSTSAASGSMAATLLADVLAVSTGAALPASLTPPTSATSSIPPYDPRACPNK